MRNLAATLLLLVGLAAGCQSNSQESMPAPLFEAKDVSGNMVSLASFRGRVVLLDFWATWCGPCRMSIPLLQSFYEKHKDDGLVVLGVNIDEDPSGVYTFTKQFQMSYPVLYGGGTSVPDSYRVEGIPLFIFVDPTGRIVKRFEGFRPDMAQEWEKQFQQLKALTSS